MRLFVYGTLTPGHDAWPVLEPWVIGPGETDAVTGHLYDTGRGYPGATFAAGAGRESLVHGVVVVLDPELAPDAFDALDDYEGPEYRRIEVRTEAGHTAAAYAWIAPLAGCRTVPDGRWDGPGA